MLRIPPRSHIIFFRFFALFLFISWLLLLCIKPVTLAPDSYTYMETAEHLGNTSSGRPILFPLLILITNALHLKLSIVCYLLLVASLVSFFGFCGPRKKLLSVTNLGILIACLLLPAIWSYCGSCLTESILFTAEIWIVIFLSFLFLPKRPASFLRVIMYSIAVCLLAILLKPWLMLYVVGCSVLFGIAALFGKAFRAARMPALVLLIVSLGAFVFSYRYNMNKTASSANIGYLLASSNKVEDLKLRLQETKDTTTEEARFISRMIDDLELMKTKYNNEPVLTPTEELKVLRVNDNTYGDTVNKAFKIAYFQQKKDLLKLMGLSVTRYVQDTKLGLACLDICYGPSIKILKKNGVYFSLAFTGLSLIVWFIRQRRQKTPFFKKPLPAKGKQLLIFIGILLLTSLFFCLFLTISGGVELPRTVLPAVLFQLAAIFYLIINSHEVIAAQQHNDPIS